MRRLFRTMWCKLAIVAGLALVTFVSVTAAYVTSIGPPPLDAGAVSRSVVDRHGKLLRAYAMPDGRWRLPAASDQVDPSYLDLLLAYEDRRFRSHHGVDPVALGRAAYQFVTHGRVVSGGSTITMQVARLLEPRRERSLAAKLRQAVRALQLERALSKNQILDLYLTLAPFGGNLEGIRAASVAYFGKEPKRLSLAESAVLVALPQSPESRRLDRHSDAARAARDRVLDRVVASGAVSGADAAQARAVAVPRMRKPMPVIAPHAADRVLAADAGQNVIKLTLDASLQRNLEALARDRAAALGPDISIAIVAVDHESGDILARVGSPDYFDDRRAGQVDMSRAVRSPGSTLKPFIYGLAFEDGFVHPDSLIDDRPIRFGSYAPENFDMTFQGTVPVRKALQLSLNVPAIALLDRVGASRLASRLKQAGANLVLPKEEAPGLAMGLGGVGISLQDLVQLYAGLARGGDALPLREVMPPSPSLCEGEVACDGLSTGKASSLRRQGPILRLAAGNRWHLTQGQNETIRLMGPCLRRDDSRRDCAESLATRNAERRDLTDQRTREPLRLMDKVAAWQVGNVLLGTPPPDNAAPNRLAFKTGTSYGYRDAWSVGFDGRITIGVWVGRPDGAPVPGLVGRTAAAPILFDAFARSGRLLAPLPKPPRGVLLASNAKLPAPLRRFRPAGELIRSGNEQALRIQFPLDGARIDASTADTADMSAMPVKVAGGTLPMTMLVNGVAVGSFDGRRQQLVKPPGPGFVRLTVMDASGAADTVVVRIQ